MSNSLFINYAISEAGVLVISCYHEKLQSFLNANRLIREHGIDKDSLVKFEKTLSNPTSQEEVKESVLNVLSQIKSTHRIQQVVFTGDLNLGCMEKEDLATFLFDRTLNQFFEGCKVHLILESSTPEYVQRAIAFATECGLKGAVIKTKTGIKDGALNREFPDEVISLTENNPNSLELGFKADVLFFKKERSPINDLTLSSYTQSHSN